MLIVLTSILISSKVTDAGSSTYAPANTYGSSAVFIPNKALYIQGGVANHALVTQAFVLDLTSSWSIHNPTVGHLQNGSPAFYSPSTLLNDNTSWLIILNRTYTASFNILEGTTTLLNPIPQFNPVLGLRATTDAETGDIIIPNGYNDPSTSINTTMRYAPSASLASSIPQPSDLDGLTFYAIAWSKEAKATFVFGGYFSLTGNTRSNALLRLNSGTTVWTKVTTTNTPIAREGACMVSIDNGARLIVFGGIDGNGTILGDIYALDVAAASWTRGPDGGINRARTGHVCAFADNKFVAWGGQTGVVGSVPGAKPEIVSVFDVAKNTWVDEFLIPGSPIPPGPIPGSPPPLTDQAPIEDSKIPLVAGCGAAIIVIVVAVLVWVYRRKESKIGERKQTSISRTKLGDPLNLEDKGLTLPKSLHDKDDKDDNKDMKNKYQRQSRVNSPQWGKVSSEFSDLQQQQPQSQQQQQQHSHLRSPHTQVLPIKQRPMESDQQLMARLLEVEKQEMSALRSPQLYKPPLDCRYHHN
ncbi:hypothetical protein BGZ94_009740 [Podila epigama]|nr:hypothetical protein BGZ94_009740 [Podila epigama]